MKKYGILIGLLALCILCGIDAAFAQDGIHTMGGHDWVAIGAGLAVGIGAAGAALSQGRVVSAALDSIGRNPSASGKLNQPMILGLVFIEALGILAFVIAYFLQAKVG